MNIRLKAFSNSLIVSLLGKRLKVLLHAWTTLLKLARSTPRKCKNLLSNLFEMWKSLVTSYLSTSILRFDEIPSLVTMSVMIEASLPTLSQLARMVMDDCYYSRLAGVVKDSQFCHHLKSFTSSASFGNPIS
ncbi:hypothetical protein Tco_0415279 [Tanacetum coccineum]